MQTLGNSTFTDAEVKAALEDSNAVFSARYEVLDVSDVAQGEIDTVTEAKIRHDTDREIKRTLELSFIDDGSLPTLTPFQSKIKVYVSIHIGSQQREWPQGIFLWTVPDRQVTDTAALELSATLNEWGGYILSASRPTTEDSIITIAEGTAADAAITLILDSVFSGLGYSSGSFPSGDPVAGLELTPDETYAEIVNSLCSTSGWYPLWWDGDGVAQIKPVPSDLTAESPDWNYYTDNVSLIDDSVEYSPDLEKLANRVLIRASNASVDDDDLAAVTELESVSPGHPYSHVTLGYYIDHDPVNDNNATTIPQLEAAGENIMMEAAFTYQKLTIQTRCVPIHESFDIVSFQYIGDTGVDFATQYNFHERGWTMDLINWTMEHTIDRIYS